MEQFISAVGKGKDWQACVAAALDNAGPLPSSANFAFIYITDTLVNNQQEILSALKQSTSIKNWVGTTGIGIICNAEEIYDEAAICIMVAHFAEETFRIFSCDEQDESFNADITNWLSPNDAHFGILHGNPYKEVEAILVKMSQSVPNSFIVGGLTSSNSDYTQIANEVHQQHASGVLFKDSVLVSTALSQGCTAIGEIHSISQCERNILMSLDNKPALDVLKSDIGETMAKHLDKISNQIFAGFPISHSDTGDYQVRNLMGFEQDNNWIAVGEMVETEQRLFFCRRDKQSAITDLTQMLQKLKSRSSDNIKGALYYSCLGRGRYLFGDQSDEMALIQKELGNVPLVGFFANGEISHQRLYGYTGVLTLFI